VGRRLIVPSPSNSVQCSWQTKYTEHLSKFSGFGFASSSLARQHLSWEADFTLSIQLGDIRWLPNKRCFRNSLLVTCRYLPLIKALIPDFEPTRIGDAKFDGNILQSSSLRKSCQQLMTEAQSQCIASRSHVLSLTLLLNEVSKNARFAPSSRPR
jgi:hypothetical protein